MRSTSVVLFTVLTGATFASAKERESLRPAKRTKERDLQTGTRTKINGSGTTTTKLGSQSAMVSLETNGIQPRIVGGEPVDAETYVSPTAVCDFAAVGA